MPSAHWLDAFNNTGLFVLYMLSIYASVCVFVSVCVWVYMCLCGEEKWMRVTRGCWGDHVTKTGNSTLFHSLKMYTLCYIWSFSFHVVLAMQNAFICFSKSQSKHFDDWPLLHIVLCWVLCVSCICVVLSSLPPELLCMHVATVFPANGEHLTFLTKKKKPLLNFITFYTVCVVFVINISGSKFSII